MKKSLKIFASIALCLITIINCSVFLCGCVIPLYIPKNYSDKQMEEIHDYLKNNLLTDLPNYIASITYPSPDENNCVYSTNIWSSEDQLIINFNKYLTQENWIAISHGVWYDGTLKVWKNEEQSEYISEVQPEEFNFIFDWLHSYAEFLKSEIVGKASYSDDSYCWQCFPWGFGMAQIYYDEIDGASVTATWAIEKYRKKNKLPLVHSAEFYYDKGIRLELYGSPYGIDERIPTIIDNYEQGKTNYFY